jgi:hypothetical protein
LLASRRIGSSPTSLNYLARLCLETERGLRPRVHLEPYMDRSTARHFDRFITLGCFPGGPVQAADLGRAHLSRQPDGSVIASVVTRTEGRRWGALSFRLEQRGGRWRVADARRLLANDQKALSRFRPFVAPARTLDRSRGR